MSTTSTVQRYVAFATTPEGGNPAGVVLDARELDDAAMLAIAADLGYSESAFLVARPGAEREYDVRYFSPVAEVPFCGHATIAAASALADRDGPGSVRLHTRAGLVPVDTGVDADGRAWATMTSVGPSVAEAAPADVDEALRALRWTAAELDPALPPRIAYAGAHHLVLAAATRDRLARLDYDFTALRALMERLDLTTVALVHREGPLAFAARNPFPVGGVVEDPATGAAAAALGGYLRALGLVTPPARITIRQGDDLGRPSRLLVDLDADRPEVRVTGNAIAIG
jgi:PhzF family phenazine biosynthesis protein